MSFQVTRAPAKLAKRAKLAKHAEPAQPAKRDEREKGEPAEETAQKKPPELARERAAKDPATVAGIHENI